MVEGNKKRKGGRPRGSKNKTALVPEHVAGMKWPKDWMKLERDLLRAIAKVALEAARK